MKKMAMAIASASLLCAAPVWADEPVEVAVPVKDPPVEVAKTAAASETNGEIHLDNAAVNRAFAGGEVAPPAIPVRPHRFGIYLGFRATNVTNPGYDPYSYSDALTQNALGLSFSPWRTQPWSVHFLAEWNMGVSSADVRGYSSELTVNRFALGAELRWMPKSRFYLFGKVVPALAHLGAEIDDWDLGVSLESSSWAPMVDLSAGAALRLGTAGKEPKRTVSFWLMMDWGFTLAGQAAMSFTPANIDDPTRSFSAVNLPGLRPGGFVTRGAFAITF